MHPRSVARAMTHRLLVPALLLLAAAPVAAATWTWTGAYAAPEGCRLPCTPTGALTASFVEESTCSAFPGDLCFRGTLTFTTATGSSAQSATLQRFAPTFGSPTGTWILSTPDTRVDLRGADAGAATTPIDPAALTGTVGGTHVALARS